MPTATSKRNGHAVEYIPPPDGPRIPRREAWVEVGEEYPGFSFKMWRNFPQHIKADLNSRDEERFKPALHAVILEHNGWLDEDGRPIPPAGTDAFWDGIPDELAFFVIKEALSETRRPPVFRPKTSAP